MYIAIEGVIGVGKTTLVRLLQQPLQAQAMLEVFEENPFLARFYGDRERYAFQTQIFFLLSRYHQHNREVPAILSTGQNLVSDYTFAKDAIFASINLQGDELVMYQRVHDALAEKIPPPDLLVYLHADTRVLMQRIAHRDRPYERNMDRAYIDQLNEAYERFFSIHHNIPVLKIETNDLDFVHSEVDYQWVENRIRIAVNAPPFQPELPLPSEAGSPSQLEL